MAKYLGGTDSQQEEVKAEHGKIFRRYGQSAGRG